MRRPYAVEPGMLRDRQGAAPGQQQAERIPAGVRPCLQRSQVDVSADTKGERSQGGAHILGHCAMHRCQKLVTKSRSGIESRQRTGKCCGQDLSGANDAVRAGSYGRQEDTELARQPSGVGLSVRHTEHSR